MIVYAVVDDALSPDFPLGVELDVFFRPEDAEQFIEEVRADDLPAYRGAGAGRAEVALAHNTAPGRTYPPNTKKGVANGRDRLSP